MFLGFFALWVLFNGRLTWEIAAFGAVISAVMYFFCCKFTGLSLHTDLRLMRLLPALLRYMGLVLCEIAKSNLALVRVVYGPKSEVAPKLVSFRTPLRGWRRSLLANSITVTPGTITVDMEEDRLTVHCLNGSFADGIEDTAFQKQLLEMQEVDK